MIPIFFLVALFGSASGVAFINDSPVIGYACIGIGSLVLAIVTEAIE